VGETQPRVSGFHRIQLIDVISITKVAKRKNTVGVSSGSVPDGQAEEPFRRGIEPDDSDEQLLEVAPA
jgi:hypothetical protein